MKTLRLILVFAAVQTASASFVTNLVVTNLSAQRITARLPLAPTESAEILSFAAAPGTASAVEMAQVIDAAKVVQAPEPGLRFYGPCTLELSIPSGFSPDGSISAILTLKVEGSTSQSVPIVNIPSNAVVIPADSAGPVTILLESSIDLITWNAAQPGTYGTSTSNRFFRVRAIR